jgi:hypothetical protein
MHGVTLCLTVVLLGWVNAGVVVDVDLVEKINAMKTTWTVGPRSYLGLLLTRFILTLFIFRKKIFVFLFASLYSGCQQQRLPTKLQTRRRRRLQREVPSRSNPETAR